MSEEKLPWNHNDQTAAFEAARDALAKIAEQSHSIQLALQMIANVRDNITTTLHNVGYHSNNVDLNGAVVHHVNKTLHIPLPRELWRPIDDGCSCGFCESHPDKTPCWDTLAVSTVGDRADGKMSHTWIVHAPEYHR